MQIHSTPKKNLGASMVEVLVALIVISVGMLGVASLYVVTLQAKTTSQARMRAINLAYDIADRIRANSAGVASYALALGTGVAAPITNCIETTSTAATVCNSAEIAAADLFQWDAMLNGADGLPGTVDRSITYVAGVAPAPDTITIHLEWTEADTGSTALTYDLAVNL